MADNVQQEKNEKLKDFVNIISQKIEKTDSHLNNVIKSNLLISFLAFLTLYYPESKIADTPISLDNNNYIFPITLVLLLGISFAMWGYYIWRFYKQRILLDIYTDKYYSGSDISSNDYNEIYKSDSTFELLYKIESRNQYLPIIAVSFIFGVNHTAFIFYIIYMLGNSKGAAITIAIIVMGIFLSCYISYFRRFKKLYNRNDQHKPELQVVKRISILIVTFTIFLTVSLWAFNKPECLDYEYNKIDGASKK